MKDRGQYNGKRRRKKHGCRNALIALLVVVLVIAAAVFIWFKAHEDEIKEAMSTIDTNVTVVLFASWCGPCEKEFPEMDEVYQKYQDKLGMIALDIDMLDNEDGAKEYAESHKLSFPIAYTNELKDKYYSSAYPTTLLIDRNGKIGFCRVGSIPDAKTFEKIVTTFMGDGYQERQLGYYTICANDGEKYIPDIEFTMISTYISLPVVKK